MKDGMECSTASQTKTLASSSWRLDLEDWLELWRAMHGLLFCLWQRADGPVETIRCTHGTQIHKFDGTIVSEIKPVHPVSLRTRGGSLDLVTPACGGVAEDEAESGRRRVR